jgi:2-polyprenyl-6-methoxyphenol hydroxylase-like FAD-dependent oxidoreductase
LYTMAEIETDVLIAGAGPVGLIVAFELRRRGVNCLSVDKASTIMDWAKANGINPRTYVMLREQGTYFGVALLAETASLSCASFTWSRFSSKNGPWKTVAGIC